MQTILKEYNEFNVKPLATIQELEEASEIVHCETVRITKSEVVFRRFCSCCARTKKGGLHPIHYFVVDSGKLDEYGDADDDLVVLDWGLL